jgi:hypothetical protein
VGFLRMRYLLAVFPSLTVPRLAGQPPQRSSEMFCYVCTVIYVVIQEGFNSLDGAYGSALHSGRCAACREAHANFVDESADNVYNEVVIIHRSQEALKMPSSLHVDNLAINRFVKKNTGTAFRLALTAHQTSTFTGWLQQLCFRSCTRL